MARRSLMFATAVLCSAAAAGWAQQDLEEGARAEEAYQDYCVMCHRMQIPPPKPRSCDEWRTAVARMSVHRERIGRSAIPDDSQILIAQYLAEYR